MHNRPSARNEKSKLEILRSIKLYELEKARIMHAVHDIEQKAARKLHLSSAHAAEKLQSMLGGRTHTEAIAHYDSLIAHHKRKLAEHDRKHQQSMRNNTAVQLAFVVLAVMLIGFAAYVGSGGITGGVVGVGDENATAEALEIPIENITNVTIPDIIGIIENVTNSTNATLPEVPPEIPEEEVPPLFDPSKINISELDATSVPSVPVGAKKLKKDKTVEEMLADTKQSYDSKKIKEIKQLSYSSEEIIFNDKRRGKGLIVHQPLFEGQTFEQFVPLVEKDEVTYSAVFEGTAVDIAFDSPEIIQDMAGKRYARTKTASTESWKTEYSFVLPAANFTPRFRISSSTPITVTAPGLGQMAMGEFSLDFAAEVAAGYSVFTHQVQPNVAYVYLSKDYTAEGKLVGDEITIDPTLTISNTVTQLCGEVTAYNLIDINTNGVLTICPRNQSSNGLGYINITLGYFGNFSLNGGSKIEGNASGMEGGPGCETTGCLAAGQGGNGINWSEGGVGVAANGGGGGGGQKPNDNDAAGGGGGGFGGAGGSGGAGSTSKGLGGNAYGSPNNLTLMIGSGGGGAAGDTNLSGGRGGPGIKIVAGAGGWIGIRGTVNVSGTSGNSTAAAADQAGGGGGSGGHFIAVAGTVNFDGGAIYADGAKGGDGTASQADNCAGGGGGGGRIYIVYRTMQANGTFRTNFGFNGLNASTDAACDQVSDTAGPSSGANGTLQTNDTRIDTLPLINLLGPANVTTNTTDSTPDFIINVTDDMQTQSTLSCTVWLQNATTDAAWFTDSAVANATPTFITASSPLNNGPYKWWINCTDGTDAIAAPWIDRTNISESRNLTINVVVAEDSTGPSINLSYPANETWITNESRTINFTFTATDASTIANCTLWTNTTENGVFAQNKTNQSIMEDGVPETIMQNFSTDFKEVLWNIKCDDILANSAMNNSNSVGTGSNRTVRLDTNTTFALFNLTNISAPFTNTWVNFSINWTDNFNLSQCGFMIANDTVHYSNVSYENCFKAEQWQVNISFKVKMNATAGQVVKYMFWANDSAGNINFTDEMTLHIANSPPIINYTSLVNITAGPNTPISIAAGTSQQVNFTFMVFDADGTGDINNATARLAINITPRSFDGDLYFTNESRFNSTCHANGTINVNTIQYLCSVYVWYWDAAGDWSINATVQDISGGRTENSSTQFKLAQTTAMVMAPTALTWSAVELGTTNKTASSGPLVINNTGNKNIGLEGFTVTGYDLQSSSSPTYPESVIKVQNFSVRHMNASEAASCTGGDQTCYECNGTLLLNDTSGTQNPQPLPYANMTIGNNSLLLRNGTSGQEELFFCMRFVPSQIARTTYDTSGDVATPKVWTDPWIVEVS